MKELKALKQKQKLFESFMSRLNCDLDSIQRASRLPVTRQEFDKIHDKWENKDEIDELWKECAETRERFPEMFQKITRDANNWQQCLYSQAELYGVIGGVRSLVEAYENIQTTEEEHCRETINTSIFEDTTQLRLNFEPIGFWATNHDDI
jgi:uncharacterized coiled-coil DUF342 family protein